MVPPGSDRVSPAPPYSGSSYGRTRLRVRGFHALRPGFPKWFPWHVLPDVAVLQPRLRLNADGLGSSAFARRYSRNHCCFLLLRVLRCFSSPGWPLYQGGMPSACRVPPFGHPRIYGHLRLPAAFRSLSRPSSPLRAKASPVRPFLTFSSRVSIVFSRARPLGRASCLRLILGFFGFFRISLYFPICLDLPTCQCPRAPSIGDRCERVPRSPRGRPGPGLGRDSADVHRPLFFLSFGQSLERRCSSRTFRYGYLVTT